MRLAVISDIHSNLQALEAVVADLRAQAPDGVIVAGDYLNRGPQPREVWQYLQTLGWPLLRGNHEDYVTAQCQSRPVHDRLANPIWQSARWTAAQIDNDPSGFAHLPISTRMATPGGEIAIAHGTERRNDEGVFFRTTDEQLAEILGESPPPLLCCGHTHVALIRQLGETLVVNAGAVGMPFNGDTRAQYAIVTYSGRHWEGELRQVVYDREACVRAYDTYGFLEGAGPLARVILFEFQTATPHLSHFVRRYSGAIHSGHTTIQAAVDAYLTTPTMPEG